MSNAQCVVRNGGAAHKYYGAGNFYINVSRETIC